MPLPRRDQCVEENDWAALDTIGSSSASCAVSLGGASSCGSRLNACPRFRGHHATVRPSEISSCDLRLNAFLDFMGGLAEE